MNKKRNNSFLQKIKKVPLAVTLTIFAAIAIEILYLYHFLTQGLLVEYGYSLGTLSQFEHWAILSALLVLLSIVLALIIYGAFNRRLWTRKFLIIILLWSLLLPIWGVAIQSYVLVNLVVIVIFSVMIAVLHAYAPLVEYFGSIFRYGEYILYKRPVLLKSGRHIIIHFFSKKTPKSGEPTSLPKQYKVEINERSKMPYLVKRTTKRIYKYGEYLLYKRQVQLKSGSTVTIHFFSKKKPKSGTPSPLPKHFHVKINKRSKMPYLKKTAK